MGTPTTRSDFFESTMKAMKAKTSHLPRFLSRPRAPQGPEISEVSPSVSPKVCKNFTSIDPNVLGFKGGLNGPMQRKRAFSSVKNKKNSKSWTATAVRANCDSSSSSPGPPNLLWGWCSPKRFVVDISSQELPSQPDKPVSHERPWSAGKPVFWIWKILRIYSTGFQQDKKCWEQW